MKTKISILLTLLMLISVSDALSTIILIKIGPFEEANPILSYVIDKIGLDGMAITKIIYTLFIVLAIIALEAISLHKPLVSKIILAGIAVYVFIYAVNLAGLLCCCL
jgi:hypothetical protein